MLQGLRDFLFRGNVLDLAIGVIIGGAFGAIVNSLVADVLTPLIGMIVGQPDFSGIKLGSILIGKFINAVVNFLLVGSAVYLFLVQPMKAYQERNKKPEAPAAPPEDITLLREIRDALKR